MTIEAAAEMIIVRFSPDDFHRKPGAYEFIAGMKNDIGHYSRNPDGFDYDDTEKKWVIADTEANRKILEELRVKCFVDPDQIDMFGS